MENQKTSSDRIERAYIYQCRICGEIKTGPIGYFTLTEATVILLELQSADLVARFGTIVSDMELHNCADGSLGLADLIGVKNVSK